MTFITNYNNEKQKEFTKLNILFWGKLKIARAKFGVTEIILDNYCHKQYKKGLKSICFIILNNIKFSSDNDGKIIGKILDPELDSIARFITYGNGQISGSQILKYVLAL